MKASKFDDQNEILNNNKNSENIINKNRKVSDQLDLNKNEMRPSFEITPPLINNLTISK